MSDLNKNPRVKSIVGLKFGRLTVVSFAGINMGAMWNCVCDCGGEKAVRGGSLKLGHTKSCGCFLRETNIKNKTTHGCAKTSKHTREYNSYCSMMARCYSINHDAYYRYGGVGVIVCDKWKGSFENFLKDMGSRPVGMTLDRIDTSGIYEPKNCRWATFAKQANNRKNNRMLTLNGKTQTASEWIKELGLSHHKIYGRLYRNWPDEKILLKP